MSILEAAKEHFKSRLGELESFDIPEWDNTTIFYKSVENLAQRAKWYPLVSAGKVEGFVEVLMVRALDQHGKKLFKESDRAELMKNVDPDVITNIASKILEGTRDKDEIEDAKKN